MRNQRVFLFLVSQNGGYRAPKWIHKWFGRCNAIMSFLEMEERTYERKHHNSFGYIYMHCWVFAGSIDVKALSFWLHLYANVSFEFF